MRKDIKSKSYVYPMPVLIVGTFDENGVPNAMNAAWGMACDLNQICICLDKNHKTVKNLLKTKAFTVGIADEKNTISADYVGVVSANENQNKLSKTGWKILKSDKVNAPIIEDLPLIMECKLVSYDENTEFCIGEIVNVSAHEEILDEKGNIDLNVFKPICYDCGGHGYYTLGERVGKAFSDGFKIK